MTLLEIVQQILSDMDGDEVNSISDTEESEQVARHVVRTFENLVSNREWLHNRELISLTPFADTDFPTHFTVPVNVTKLELINYDKIKSGETRKQYQKVEWKEPDEFLNILNKRDSSASNVQTVTDSSGSLLFILNDTAPNYYTSFNDSDIVMDSFDSEVDTTLQASKVQAMGFILPSLSLVDDAEPDLPQEALSLLIEESTSRAQFKTRQIEDVKSEQESRRQARWMARNQWKINGGIKYRDYGRKK